MPKRESKMDTGRDVASLRVREVNGQKTFKGGKDVTSQIVYKANKVEEEHDAFYQPFTPKEKP